MDVELRELRLFLVLADELHFGRTAERLGLTTSRVSQTLRALERKLGGRPLVARTSRVVSLTEAGRALRVELDRAVAGLDEALARARARAAGPGQVRVGVLNAASGSVVLNEAIKRFETEHPGASVRLMSSPFDDRLGPLRGRQVDVTVTRLPLDQPDITVGPTLSEGDRRVVMVATDHPLADRADVSVEDFADYPMRRPNDVPPELAEASCPSRTPSGRRVTFSAVEVNDVSELLLLIAQGRLVHPTVAPFAEHFRHPGIAIVPVRDLPPSSSALAWLSGTEDPGRDAFVACVRRVVAGEPRSARDVAGAPLPVVLTEQSVRSPSMDPSTSATEIAAPSHTPETRATEKPATATRSLPGVAYTDPLLYEQELVEVFERSWVLVGHITELAEPGQYVTANVGREPVLVVRGHDGELRAMSNVCRHRASLLLEGTGRTRSVMRCPYHAWTYELDGQLAAAPSGQGFACLDRDQVALPQFRIGVVGGLVFCCLDPDQMSLAEMLGPVGPYLEWLNVSGLQVHRGPEGARWTEDFAENWKILADNYYEDYHVPVAHPILVRLVDVKETIGDNNDWCEWSRVPYRSRPSRDEREREYQSLRRRMPGMPEEFENAMGHVCIWPTTFFEIYPHHIDMWQLEPTGLHSTRATTMTLVHPDETEQDQRARALMREMNVDIMGQDVDITTRVQRGVQAPSYHSGILNDEQEFSVIRFQKRLRELLPRIAELEATATGERSVATP